MRNALILILLACFLFFSCATDELPPEEDSTPVEVEETAVQDVPSEPAFNIVIEEEPDIVIIEEPEPEPEYFTDQAQKEEYLRSISTLSEDTTISPEVFEADKDQIFYIISDLDRIMKKKDYNGWLAYLSPESKEYWSNRHNLTELSMHMSPTGDFRINNLREYFEYFFIPARRGRAVDEIRYVTPDYVKVVQYKNNTDIIYYFFEKLDGEWKLWLDTL